MATRYRCVVSGSRLYALPTVAVFLVTRAIVWAGAGYRVVKTEQQASGQPGPLDFGSYLWQRLQGNESDEALTAAVSERTGTLASVTTYADPFSLRKLQVRWGRSAGGSIPDDDLVTTHHFAKVSGGSVVDTWLEADFTGVESAFTAFWTAIKPKYLANVTLKQYRWYKAGPQDVPPQAPVRILDVNAAGTKASGAQLPYQVSVSVTERTTDPKSWGRFYLPAPEANDAIGPQGRLGSIFHSLIADSADAMYEAWLSAGTPGVVYSTAKPERETAGGSTLPAKAARALSVDTVQVDDIFDVIRSRRLSNPLLRLQRAVGA
jgi:hypothetical protein